MLQRLELVGFKSFADKTQFDFPAGLTAIVGPNGSGKSNIVDSVRWLLGEQSAKSLRGGAMADVIFNGSTSRRSLGLAEVTMTFDNRRRQLPIDTEEVQITRRVYRSGEGEYLINQQLSRLKDIKDLFLGSGAGNNAYSIIEQGRVDSLLQSSTQERRAIFEEAAGISRFKARKIETLRKLERVDLNLQRLRDIIDEVNNQLRSVRLAAGKAQRYQEYSQRLKELRVGLSLDEYHRFSQQLQSEMTVLEGLRTELAQRSEQVQSWETEVRRLDESLGALDETIHADEARQAQARQQIVSEGTTLAHEQELSLQLEADLVESRKRLTELHSHLATLLQSTERAAQESAAAEAQCQQQRQEVHRLEDGLQSTIVRLANLSRQIQADRTEQMEQVRRVTNHQNDVRIRQHQVETLQRERDRLRHAEAQAAEHLASLDLELEELTAADEAIQARLVAAKQALADRNQDRDRYRYMSEAAGTLKAELSARRSGLASRIEVLDGLVRSHEGVGAGAREVLALLEEPDPGAWRTVIGLVADALTVPHESAALIDLALGETAQRFLVRDTALLKEMLAQRQQPFSGRVGFIPLENGEWGKGNISAHDMFPQLQAMFPDAWQLLSVVHCENPELARLPAQLLGNVIVVFDLEAARQVQRAEREFRSGSGGSPASQFRYVTLQGEVLEADGTLTVGTHHAETGILARKSELRELRQQATTLDRRIAETEQDVIELRGHASALETEAAALQEEIDGLTGQAGELRSQIGQHQQRRATLHEDVQSSQSELNQVEQEIPHLEEACRQAQAHAQAAERQSQALKIRLEQAEQEIREREELRQQQEQKRSEARQAMGTVEARAKALQAQQRQQEADLAQRRQEQQQSEKQLAAARSRIEESLQTMLRAQAALAHWYLEKEIAERAVSDLTATREQQRRQRHTLTEQLQAAQSAWREQREQAAARELAASDVSHKRDTLAQRLREDYQLDLAELYQEKVASGQWPVVSEEPGPGTETSPPTTDHSLRTTDPAAAEREIEELRRKLAKLGSVNLDALQELAELENRANTLQVQHDDLTSAQRSLQEIIAKINQDSRKLFGETLTAIRGHFQELFRKLFGGGMADIVIEDETDILESGIEIIAKPPGKELRSISLMSGGEKTLTAVALLLAIFRSKPSPFCILDEVDAALDEANIGRFTAVLREFLDQSQFILITHSKKTMATADVLYGITMQESGVSKRVSVRFEDWPDDNGQPTPASTSDGDSQSFAGR